MGLKKIISAVVFWGAVWGITEATLGSLLHVINFNVGWLFWFPIAFYFTNKVYKQTGKYESILFLSVIAAAIKLIDLVLPIRIDMVINPAVSILLEGLVVFATFKAAEKYKGLLNSKFLEVAVISFSWRALYAAYVLFLPAWLVAISPIRGVIPFLRFFLFEGAANSVIIFIAIKLFEEVNKLDKVREIYSKQLIVKVNNLRFLKEIDFLPLSSFSLLIAAIIIQWVL